MPASTSGAQNDPSPRAISRSSACVSEKTKQLCRAHKTTRRCHTCDTWSSNPIRPSISSCSEAGSTSRCHAPGTAADACRNLLRDSACNRNF